MKFYELNYPNVYKQQLALRKCSIYGTIDCISYLSMII